MPKWQKACWNTSEPKCQSCVHSSGSCFGMKGKGRNSRAPWIKLQHTSMVGTSNDCPRIIDHGSLLSAFIIGKEPTLGSWSQKKRGGNRHEDMTTFKSVHNATGSVHIKSFSKIVFNSRLFWYPSQSDIFRKCRRSSRASVGYAALSLSSTLEVNQTSQSQLARNMADHNTVGLAGDSLLLWYYSSTCLIFLCYDKWNKVIPDPSHRRLGMIE